MAKIALYKAISKVRLAMSTDNTQHRRMYLQQATGYLRRCQSKYGYNHDLWRFTYNTVKALTDLGGELV